MKLPYEVKYKILPARLIVNLNGPQFKQGTPNYNWDPKSLEEREKFAEKWVKKYDRISNNFYTRLAESLKTQGCVDPIVVTAGAVQPKMEPRLPPHMRKFPDNILACIGPGCSRLYFLQKWNWTAPCLILDYNNLYPNAELLDTEEKIISKWTNRPKGIVRGRYMLSIKGNIHFD